MALYLLLHFIVKFFKFFTFEINELSFWAFQLMENILQLLLLLSLMLTFLFFGISKILFLRSNRMSREEMYQENFEK